MSAAHDSTTGDIDVQINSPPGTDLTALLNKMRAEYEDIAEDNRRDVETWFNEQVRATCTINFIENSSLNNKEDFGISLFLKIALFQTQELNRQINTSVEETSSNKNEITELKRNLQSLEIELQSQMSLV